jgi:ribosomal-protein-alanine N-acetyltransferase
MRSGAESRLPFTGEREATLSMIAEIEEKYLIRLMTPEDVDEVLRIEQVAFRSPWPKSAFLNEFKHSCSHQFVIESTLSGVVSYAIFWMIAQEIHILNIATDPGHRRRGLAKELLNYIILFGNIHQMEYIVLEVRTSNKNAIRLYEGMAFEHVETRRKYYPDNDEDAYVMMLQLRERR